MIYMNTKTTKFLAVLAVLAMAFAAVAFVPSEETDAATTTSQKLDSTDLTLTGASYTGSTKTLAITGYESMAAAYTFTGTDIIIVDNDSSVEISDAEIAATGLVVKKNVTSTTTTTYSSSLGAAMGTISYYSDNFTTAQSNPVNLTVLANFTETTAGKNTGTSATTYAFINIDLGGYTVKLETGLTLVGDNTHDKYLSFGLNTVGKIINGTIDADITYADISNKDMGFVLIQTYGPLTLGDGSATLTLDISGSRSADSTTSENLATAVQFQAGASVIYSKVTIEAGDNFAFMNNFGAFVGNADKKVGAYTINAGTSDSATVADVGVKVTIEDGAVINGNFGNTFYTTGVSGETQVWDAILIGSRLDINGGTFSGTFYNGLGVKNGGDYPAAATASGAVNAYAKVSGGTFDDTTFYTMLGSAPNPIYPVQIAGDVTISGDSKINYQSLVTVRSGATVTIDGDATLTIDGAGAASPGAGLSIAGTVIANGDIELNSGIVTVADGGSLTLNGYLTQEGDSYLINKENVIIASNVGGAITLAADDATVTMSAGATFDGILYAGTDVSDLDVATLDIEAGSDKLTFSVGSIYIDGEIASGDITVADGAVVEITGTADAGVTITLGENSKLVIPSGESMVFTSTAITGPSSATIEVLGAVSGSATVTSTTVDEDITVEASNPDAVAAVIGGDVDVGDITSMYFLVLDGTDDLEELADLFSSYDYIGIVAGDSVYTLTVDDNLDVPEGKAIYLGVQMATAITESTAGSISDMVSGTTVYIKVDADCDMTVTSAKIYDGSTDKEGIISVYGTLNLDAADVCTTVIVPSAAADGYIDVQNPLSLTATGIPTSDLTVGYGNTLTMTGVTIPSGKNVYAYGELVIEGSNTVSYNARIITYDGSEMTVNGSLTVEGAVVTAGETTVAGTVTVFRSAGYASWTSAGTLTVLDDATFDVKKGRQSDAGPNSFSSVETWVYGTSTITGTLNGIIYDRGTITFDGTAGTAAIIFLGTDVTLKVDSVTGSLIVSDYKAALEDTWDEDEDDYKEYVYVFDGNYFTLENVKGVTLTATTDVTVDTVTDADSDEHTVKYYVSSLELTGTASSVTKGGSNYIYAVGGMVEKDTAYGVKWDYDDVMYGSATIGDLTLGKNSTLTFYDNVNNETNIEVAGEVTVVAEGSAVYFNNTGYVYVSGEIYVNDKDDAILGDFTGKVSATYYTYTDTEDNKVEVLTNFAAALAVILSADDKEIVVNGYQMVFVDSTIPAGGNVVLASGAYLYIASTATVEIEATATVDASAGTINVVGVLIVDDKDTGLKHGTAGTKFIYQVKTEDGLVVTYCGILGALERAVSGDVITMSQSGTIDEDAVIPEGVTLIVPSNITLTVGNEDEEIVLIVNGTLKALRNAGIAQVGEEVTIVPNGAMLMDSSVIPTGDVEMDNYALFTKKIDGRTYTVVSNLTYAAENVETGDVYIEGKVKAGDISFVPAKDETITIYVPAGTSTHQNGISVSSMLLDRTTLIATEGTSNGIVSGTIIAASEYELAQIVLKEASGITIQAAVEETAEGNVYHVYIMNPVTSTAFDGTVEIADGMVTMDGNLSTSAAKTSVFKVSGDAVFVIATGTTFKVGYYEDGTNVTLAGSVIVNGILDIDGAVSITGLVTVLKEKATSDADVEIDGAVTITGTVIVVEDEKLGDAKFNINTAKVKVGKAATSIGDAASLAGPVTIAKHKDAILIAYPGCDITLAKINWNSLSESSDAVSTDVYVYETLYATAYAADTSAVPLNTKVFTSSTKITGYDIKNTYKDLSYWYTDSAYKTNLTDSNNYVGNKATVYYKPTFAKVYGTVTVGVGLTLYVDGKIFDQQYWSDDPYLTVGTHSVYVQYQSGYEGDNVTIKFNGVNVPATATGGTITVTADMDSFTLVADGAEPYTPEPTPEPEKESEWTITTILLCVLVVLIAIMAVIVALRLNRN